MSEINTGVRSILKHGWIYRLAQSFFREKKSKQYIIDHYLTDLSGDMVLLDMGCGAGNFAYFIPRDTNYIGFDPNENYIATARNHFSSNVRFKFCTGTAVSRQVNDQVADASVDYALVHGVLHHLSDTQIIQMYNMAARVLKPAAKMISLEPVWYDGQSTLNKNVMQLDRGKNIKNQSSWLAMADDYAGCWGSVEFEIKSNLIRFYDLIIIEITKDS